MSTAAAPIVVRDLTMAYGSFVIQRDLTFTVQRGDIFIIMGGSGCGKSTLLRHLIGLMPPAKGDVLIDGENFWTAPPEDQERLNGAFGVLFQSGGAVEFHDAGRERGAAAAAVYGSELQPDWRSCVAQAGPGWARAASRRSIPRKSVAACRNGPGWQEPWPSIPISSSSMNLPRAWTPSARGAWTS